MPKSSDKILGEKARITDVSPKQAFEILLALGAETSLNQLYGVLIARFENPPSIHTLQNWSAEHQWQRRLAIAASRIAAAVEDGIIARKAKAKLREIVALERVIEHAFDKAGASLAGDRAKDGTPLPATRLDGSVGAVVGLVKAGVEASKHRQLLLGEATERSESRELLAGVPDDSLVDRFRRAAAKEKAEPEAEGTMH